MARSKRSTTTTYSPRWARGRRGITESTLSTGPSRGQQSPAAFNDLERHNNTNNTDTPSADGPLQHVDHSRVVSLGTVLAPNERYSFDFNYSYSDVYISTNACYLSGASVLFPGAASTTSAGAPNLCPNLLTDWGPVKDFMDAPTQYASFGVTYSPNKVLALRAGLSHQRGQRQPVLQRCAAGQRLAAVRLSVALCECCMDGPSRTGLEGGLQLLRIRRRRALRARPSAALQQLATSAVVPCNSSTLTGPTGLTESPSGMSAPRNFHANNLTLAIHYEF